MFGFNDFLKSIYDWLNGRYDCGISQQTLVQQKSVAEQQLIRSLAQIRACNSQLVACNFTVAYTDRKFVCPSLRLFESSQLKIFTTQILFTRTQHICTALKTGVFVSRRIKPLFCEFTNNEGQVMIWQTCHHVIRLNYPLWFVAKYKIDLCVRRLLLFPWLAGQHQNNLQVTFNISWLFCFPRWY